MHSLNKFCIGKNIQTIRSLQQMRMSKHNCIWLIPSEGYIVSKSIIKYDLERKNNIGDVIQSDSIALSFLFVFFLAVLCNPLSSSMSPIFYRHIALNFDHLGV